MEGDIEKRDNCPWKDVSSAILLYFIWVVHMGTASGLLREYIGQIANSCFFMIAGFFAINARKYSVRDYIVKNVKRLLIPYICWACINIFFHTLQNNGDIHGVITGIRMFIYPEPGVMTYGGALWFLPGIFICKIVYELLRRLLKNYYLVCVFCVGIMIAIEMLCKRGYSILRPAWGLSLYYMFFYSLGPVFFPLFDKAYEIIHTKSKIMIKKVYYALMGIFVLGDGIIYFFGGAKIYGDSVLLKIVILLWVTVSFVCFTLFIKNMTLEKIGKSTIVFCGAEYIVKSLMPLLCNMVNIQFAVKTPMECMLYILFCFAIMYNFLLPVVRSTFPGLEGRS